MADKYDVVIVGSGPAGIFTALELAQSSKLNILLLEKGKPLEKRACPGAYGYSGCLACPTCAMVSGWGGAGAYSDGKLTLSPEIGGRLQRYIGDGKLTDLINYVDRRYLDFGAADKIYGTGSQVKVIEQKAEAIGLRLIPMPIRHLGTERCYKVLREMHEFLADRVEMRTEVTVESIQAKAEKITGVITAKGEEIQARYVIVSPGREGSDWLMREADILNLTTYNNPVDLGLRVEVAQEVLQDLTDILYEPKLEYRSTVFNDRIRTFCVCPSGEVTMESTGGEDPVVTVNGHSYANRKTSRTNFALLGSAMFGEPFKDPITYGRSIAKLGNLLADGVIMQRYGDLQMGHCSQASDIRDWAIQPTLKSATPGDINSVLPYRFMHGIKEMLLAMDKLAPGIASADTLLYGIEVKFYSSRLELTENLETEIENLFTIGDGAGVTRGLVQASASGVVAAREVLRRNGNL
ncbi:MAG: FAD-dependent oxidoreductase [Dehalococcoidia bacterium]